MKLLIFEIVIVVLAILISCLIFRAIWMSDLPDWLKFMLLRK